MSIYERVCEVHQSVRLTQRKFAERLSISNSYLAGIEIGDNDVNDRIIKLIIMAFNVDEH